MGCTTHVLVLVLDIHVLVLVLDIHVFTSCSPLHYAIKTEMKACLIIMKDGKFELCDHFLPECDKPFCICFVKKVVSTH